MPRPLGDDDDKAHGVEKAREDRYWFTIHTKIQVPKENHFPINKREKERKERGRPRKTNKRIGEKQQLEPFKIEQQIKLSNRGYR